MEDKFEKISIYPRKSLLLKIKEISMNTKYSMNKLILIILEDNVKQIEKNGISYLYNSLDRANE